MPKALELWHLPPVDSRRIGKLIKRGFLWKWQPWMDEISHSSYSETDGKTLIRVLDSDRNLGGKYSGQLVFDSDYRVEQLFQNVTRVVKLREDDPESLAIVESTFLYDVNANNHIHNIHSQRICMKGTMLNDVRFAAHEFEFKGRDGVNQIDCPRAIVKSSVDQPLMWIRGKKMEDKHFFYSFQYPASRLIDFKSWQSYYCEKTDESEGKVVRSPKSLPTHLDGVKLEFGDLGTIWDEKAFSFSITGQVNVHMELSDRFQSGITADQLVFPQQVLDGSWTQMHKMDFLAPFPERNMIAWGRESGSL